ncbi:MAG: hypothetical protein A3C50_01385 [Candidatus Staskawiczbacteria bacterium RIFCSPHIGHO2_02_FULL_43_16]|uniref:Uncharacterized protein n=1 Tax=Candidatus Staskawiczbacteria bacterium RIFCSPHIGHO2_01_FULL_41_41 TaxID=1802203 RepID=A0A1G2HSE1_9BACT|nr:MAG: hypothetical protein A2822_02415 [Candidatus Staskawiczbacteria bacterium RIFCSPHIGHO2_01_FULL_41_41]OGZ69036.1 MAG: hypothetical protein A3C50_01385 [Candidatus Staskawiczbacteria bacterium RIFCSPHIGHO2_02_FULL_43_16]OGZ74535.1 MAG: hypothetical protein A3A12_02110 [Candidatus Staskawiczbacteria bacterium RIFCSPLOWO2_01_FULL_43_17b]
MIQQGLIRKVGQYYRNAAEYQEEVLRGKKEFFDLDSNESVDSLDTDIPLFNEWMMYDFRFSDGKNMFEKFYYENPLKIPSYRREIYKTLLENYYGLFQVLEIRPFFGLTIKRLSDEKVFEVMEMSLTTQVGAEDVFIGRVAKVIDHYELVGADTKAVKMSQSNDEKLKKYYLEKVFPKTKMDTPKDAYIFFKNM